MVILTKERGIKSKLDPELCVPPRGCVRVCVYYVKSVCVCILCEECVCVCVRERERERV